MFWKRKDKKKAAEDVGADTTATAVDDTADTSASATDESAETTGAEATAGTDAAKEPATATAAESADTDTTADSAAAPESAVTPVAAKDAKADPKAKAKPAADDDPAEVTAAAATDDEPARSGATAAADDTAAAATESETDATADTVTEPGATEADDDGIQCVRTSGTLTFEDEEYEVVSNTWIIQADDDGVLVIDPAHDAEAILEVIGDREIHLVACTNGYNTHIQTAVEVAAEAEAPIALHRRELRAWRKVHGVEHNPDIEIEGGGSLTVGDLEVDILATPGTSVGTVAFYISERGAVFSGDTLLAGRMGRVGNDYIDYTTQLASVGEVLLSLPPDTRVLPDNGVETTVAAETKNFDDWLDMS